MADEKNFNEDIEEVKDAVEETVAEAKDAVEDAAAAVEETVEEVVEAAEETVEEAVETVEETAEAAEETVEETVAAVEEKIEDAAEEVADEAEAVVEEISEVDKAVAQAMAERDAQEAAVKAKKSKTAKKVTAIVAAVIVVLGALLSGFVVKDSNGGIKFSTYAGWLPKLCNPYNHKGFVDVTGNTVGSVSEQMGMTVPEFLEKYGLPANMSASTAEMVALYMMPAKNYAEDVCGIDFAQLKEILHVPDKTEDGEEITEATPWHIVEGEIAIKDYIGGEDKFDEFKTQYELGDEVTPDTKWKEIRTAVDTKSLQLRKDSEKAAKKADSADDEAEAPAAAEPEATEKEAPAEEKAEEAPAEKAE